MTEYATSMLDAAFTGNLKETQRVTEKPSVTVTLVPVKGVKEYRTCVELVAAYPPLRSRFNQGFN